jgi:sulfoxide reductase heme-binding subunit YedZ
MTLWYLARGAGLTAMLVLSIATALGAWSSSSKARRDGPALSRRFTLQRAHLAAAVTGLSLVVVHVLALVLDSASGVWAGAAIIPMTSGYRPFAVTLGVVALYLLVLVAVTGAMRGRLAASSFAARTWRMVHASAYGAWALAVGHGIFAGTDSSSGPVIILDVMCVAMVVGALSWRLRAEDAHDEAPLSRSRRTSRSLSSGGVR